MLRLRWALYAGAADAASGRGQSSPAMVRQMRTELRNVSALDVPAVRRQADDVARQLRELDDRIQQANWEVDLADWALTSELVVAGAGASTTRG